MILDQTPAFLLDQFGWTRDNPVKDVITAPDPMRTLNLRSCSVPRRRWVYIALTAGITSAVEKKVAMAHETNGDMGNVLAEEDEFREARCAFRA